MGVFSELDLVKKCEDAAPFTDRGEDSIPSVFSADADQPVSSIPKASAAPASAAQIPASSSANNAKKAAEDDAAKRKADEESKRKAHEEAEAKRKAEWEAKQAAKKAAEEEQMKRLATLTDDEVMMASIKRVGDDVEKLTRRNMKDFVSEHIQTKCLEDAAFARLTMYPRKSMVHCFWYINRKAQEYLLKEMEMNGEKPSPGERIGGDVPDDLCYQWAEDYFRDSDAEEDQDKEDKFVPKPYPSGYTPSVVKKKEASKGKEAAKSTAKTSGRTKAPESGQMTLGDLGMMKESA